MCLVGCPIQRILAPNPIFCFGNQIFLNGAFVTVYVKIIFAFGLITISLFVFELKPFERGSQFLLWKFLPGPTVGICVLSFNSTFWQKYLTERSSVQWIKKKGNIFEKPLYLIELGWTGPFSVVMKTEKEDFKVKSWRKIWKNCITQSKMILDTRMTKKSWLQADEINDDNGWRSLASRVYQDWLLEYNPLWQMIIQIYWWWQRQRQRQRQKRRHRQRQDKKQTLFEYILGEKISWKEVPHKK